MQSLKVCFVGVGSIAKRHIKNLKQICNFRGILLQIDAYRHLQTDAINGVDHIYTSISDVPNDYDIVFITNPTEYHLNALENFHNKGHHFFIEKPVVSVHQLKQVKEFKCRHDSIYYVACPLRYNAVIQYIKNNIIPTDVISVRSISSSYLPEWRPGQDYRKTYSAHKALGGGVSIDLIHEWDYLTYLFGWPSSIHSLIGKKSNLEIDSDDFAIYIAAYPDKTVELHLDYFGRKTIRQIELFTKDSTIIGDLANNRVINLVTGEEINYNEKRDSFQIKELEFFLDLISGNAKAADHFNHAIKILALSQGELSYGKAE